MIERKVYPGWAFSENESEKKRINTEIYSEIENKAKVELVKRGNATEEYLVLSNPEDLSDDELALICDKGNLCFGYRKIGDKIIIYTD